MGRNFHHVSQQKALHRKYTKNKHKTRQNRTKGRNDKRKKLAIKASKFILNLSNHSLTDIEKIALGRGLNFIPTPKKPRKQILMEACDNLARTMRIRYHAATKGWKPIHHFRNPSTWIPRPTICNSLEDYLESIKLELSKIPIHNAIPNTSYEESHAIKGLKHNPDLIFKKYDKGRGICIMSKTDYKSEGLRHLQDQASYMKLDHDMTSDTIQMIHETIEDSLKSKEIDKATASYLDPRESLEKKTPVFFMLPKIHKQPKPGYKFIGRPVVSGCGSPLNRISEFIDHYLLPEVQKLPTYLKDTADTIRMIENLVLPDNITLATFDVVNMFTSVLQEEAFEKGMETFHIIDRTSCNPKMPTPTQMGKLLKLVLYRNAFEFDGSFYLQQRGVPMGLRSSVSLSCLVVDNLIKHIMNMSPHIISFNIYMDDALVTWKGTMEELDLFVEEINLLHKTLQFTYTASKESITFLDLEIYKGDRFKESNILDIRCHTKETETWGYLERDSCHNPAVFKAFMKGELIRYARNSSNRQSYDLKKENFLDKLIERGYTKEEFEEASGEVIFNNRKLYISEKDKQDDIPLVYKQKYFPHISGNHIKNAILKDWKIIEEHNVLKKIFTNPPILAYSRTQNLRDKLVRARFNYNEEEEDEKADIQEDPTEISPTLQVLQDLERESRGFNDSFFYDNFVNEI